jgi:hypothetical protein
MPDRGSTRIGASGLTLWKGLPGTNILAYWSLSYVPKKKSFMKTTPGANPIKLFKIKFTHTLL